MDGRPHLFHNLPLPSQLLHRYQLILLGDRSTRVWTTCLRLLHSSGKWESSLQSPDHYSDAVLYLYLNRAQFQQNNLTETDLRLYTEYTYRTINIHTFLWSVRAGLIQEWAPPPGRWFQRWLKRWRDKSLYWWHCEQSSHTTHRCLHSKTHLDPFSQLTAAESVCRVNVPLDT